MNYSPGPWRISEDADTDCWWLDEAIMSNEGRIICWMNKDARPGDVRLIAAARDLLKACEELLLYIEADNDIQAIMYPESLRYAQSVIQKATGK